MWPLLTIDCKQVYIIQSPEVLARNIQGQEGSPQEVANQYPTYINLDPDHCHPVQHLAMRPQWLYMICTLFVDVEIETDGY